MIELVFDFIFQRCLTNDITPKVPNLSDFIGFIFNQCRKKVFDEY